MHSPTGKTYTARGAEAAALNGLEPLGTRPIAKNYLGWQPTDVSFSITRSVAVRITSPGQLEDSEDTMFPTVTSKPGLDGTSLERTVAVAPTRRFDSSSSTHSI